MATSGHVTSYDVLGHFSVDGQRDYHHDHRSKRFFVQPDDEPDFDLREGIEEYVGVPYHGLKPKSMTNLLMWMKNERKMLRKKGLLRAIPGTPHYRLAVDVVGRHGVLSDLLKSHVLPERRDILVTLFRGTFYIEIMEDTSRDPDFKTLTYAGRKFRQHVTSVDGQQPDTSLPVNANVGYYAAMTARCVGRLLLFGVEVHAERQGSQAPPPGNYLQVKTKKDETELKWYKTMKWWADCAFSGVPEVVCGNRDDVRGRAKSVKMYRTSDIPYDWTPDDAFTKFRSLLNDIKGKVIDDDPRSVYHLVLEEEPKGRRILQKVRKFTVEGKYPDEYVILPDWYINEVLGGE